MYVIDVEIGMDDKNNADLYKYSLFIILVSLAMAYVTSGYDIFHNTGKNLRVWYNGNPEIIENILSDKCNKGTPR